MLWIIKKICKICGRKRLISDIIGICLECIKKGNIPEEISKIHSIPKEDKGKKCQICVNQCSIENNLGRCQVDFSKKRAYLQWYYDPLPTNCVASWICGANKYGYYNLAVFYESCSFNCLFCQNWHFRERKGEFLSPEELAEKVNNRTFCVCFFGGDPTPYIWHSIKTAKIILNKNKIRICWETNGSFNPNYAPQIAKILKESQGNIKIEIKALNPYLHFVLTGSSNENTLKNFKFFANYDFERKKPPPLIASTLIIPGYISPEEIYEISKFIAQINPEIPYSLLAFYPNYLMTDLPTTSKSHMYECYKKAKQAGLKNIHIGNIHLLW